MMPFIITRNICQLQGIRDDVNIDTLRFVYRKRINTRIVLQN